MVIADFIIPTHALVRKRGGKSIIDHLRHMLMVVVKERERDARKNVGNVNCTY